MTASIQYSDGSSACSCHVLLILGIIMGRVHVITAEAVPSEDPQTVTTPQPAQTTLNCANICMCDLPLSSMRCDNRNFTQVPGYTREASFDVEILNLSFNRITIIHNSSFAGMENLTILHLEYNQIWRIQAGSFQHLHHLRHLYLERNRLEYLDPLIFKGLSRLAKLNLGQNKIKEIPPGLFVHTPRLNSLDLSGNQLIYLPNSSAFVHLTNLYTLNLARNGVRNFKLNTLSRLPSLKYLYLSHIAGIGKLDSNVLVPLKNLIEVDFSRSSIHTILNPWELAKLKHLKIFDLNGLTFKCDCNAVDLREIVSLMTTRGVKTSKNYDSMTCTLSNAIRQTVKIKDLKCEFGHIILTKKVEEEPLELTYRIPYDPMLGWYTAATLSTLLGGFLVCVGLDKLKNKYIIYRYNQRKRKREMEEAEQSTPLQAGGKKPGDRTGDSGDSESSEDPDGEYESQNDSTINPDDQPMIPSGQSAQQAGSPMSGRRSPNQSRRNSHSSRHKRGKLKSDSNRNYTSHPCITEAIRPDTLPRLDIHHAQPGIKSQTGSALPEKRDLLNMQIIEIHPDCPIHSKNKSRTYGYKNKLVESNV